MEEWKKRSKRGEDKDKIKTIKQKNMNIVQTSINCAGEIKIDMKYYFGYLRRKFVNLSSAKTVITWYAHDWHTLDFLIFIQFALIENVSCQIR